MATTTVQVIQTPNTTILSDVTTLNMAMLNTTTIATTSAATSFTTVDMAIIDDHILAIITAQNTDTVLFITTIAARTHSVTIININALPNLLNPSVTKY